MRIEEKPLPVIVTVYPPRIEVSPYAEAVNAGYDILIILRVGVSKYE